MAVLNLAEVYLRILPDKFHYLKFILEGYDNLALLSAYDCSAGIVVVRYPQETASEVFRLLTAIAAGLTGVQLHKQ